jgi:SAM-dependent methyltransferase
VTAILAEEPRLEYIGEELTLFQLAENWKRYVASRLRPYIHGRVLEVGAGLGANVPYFFRSDLSGYVSLEPDGRLCDEYRRQQLDGKIPAACELVQGTLDSLAAEETFDTIIYIDVLEHIEDDRAEFARAFSRLRSGGRLCILCPAHNRLYSPFDQAIGHFRRYDKRMFRALSDERPLVLEYLDSAGLLASGANKLLLRQTYPNEQQILLWDRVLVRLSRCVDPLVARRIGKSILGVWAKA